MLSQDNQIISLHWERYVWVPTKTVKNSMLLLCYQYVVCFQYTMLCSLGSHSKLFHFLNMWVSGTAFDLFLSPLIQV